MQKTTSEVELSVMRDQPAQLLGSYYRGRIIYSLDSMIDCVCRVEP